MESAQRQIQNQNKTQRHIYIYKYCITIIIILLNTPPGPNHIDEDSPRNKRKILTMEDDSPTFTKARGTRNKKGKQFVEIVNTTDILGFQKPELQQPDYYVPPKRASKYRHMSAKEIQRQRKLHLKAKLRFIVDVTHVPKDAKMEPFDEWQKIEQVLATGNTAHPFTCPICLSQTVQITAPQITPCGHVFCFPCVLTHLKVSGKKDQCPVCNDWINKSELRPCLITHKQPIVQGCSVKMVLRIRDPVVQKVYDPSTLLQDLNFSPVIRAQKHYIYDQLMLEKESLENYMGQYMSEGSTQQVPYIMEAIDINTTRLAPFRSLFDKYSLKNQKLKGQTITQRGLHLSTLENKFRKDLLYFYGEEFGRAFFLHPICEKHLMEDYMGYDTLPIVLNSKVIYTERMSLDEIAIKKYKILAHLPLNMDVTFMEVTLKDKLSPGAYTSLSKQINKHKSRIIAKEESDTRKHEELVTKRLAKLQQKKRKLFEQEVWPVDDQLRDLKNCNKELNFPELVSAHSAPSTVADKEAEQTPPQQPTLPTQESFPELGDILANKAQSCIQPGKGAKQKSHKFGKKNKGKQQQVVALGFFQEPSQDH